MTDANKKYLEAELETAMEAMSRHQTPPGWHRGGDKEYGPGPIVQSYRSQQQGMQNQVYGATEAVAEVPLSDVEYLVVGFHTVGTPDFFRARDAAEMQQAVERIRQRGDQKQISVFKRMIRMTSKTEWETVDADV
jgi:hypothetical protein